MTLSKLYSCDCAVKRDFCGEWALFIFWAGKLLFVRIFYQEVSSWSVCFCLERFYLFGSRL
jgi:hypothetical protein